MKRHSFVLSMLLALLTVPALAINADERLKDQVQEQRARDISAELRCLVCQNQSIDDSDATLAKDLRKLVRERIVAGDSDTQLLNFVVARYGEFVLLRPPFNVRTAVLWGLPVAAVLAGAIFLVSRRRRNLSAPEPLSEAEQRSIDILLADADHKS